MCSDQDPAAAEAAAVMAILIIFAAMVVAQISAALMVTEAIGAVGDWLERRRSK